MLGVIAASATPAVAAPAIARTPLVGSTYVQVWGGKAVTFHQIDDVTSVAYNLTVDQPNDCQLGYACGWDTTGWSGTIWRYNMNNVYANTANGVAHCWNLATGARNRFSSFANHSDRTARFVDNTNCNQNAGWFDEDPGPIYYGSSCALSSLAAWCDRVSSIRASA
jgi:hypothetical protein